MDLHVGHLGGGSGSGSSCWTIGRGAGIVEILCKIEAKMQKIQNPKMQTIQGISTIHNTQYTIQAKIQKIQNPELQKIMVLNSLHFRVLFFFAFWLLLLY